VWNYPELGMQVTLWDRFLNQSYDYPYTIDRDLDPRPDLAALQSRPDLMSVAGGRGVFRAMAPGSRPIAVRAGVSRFPLQDGTRLLAHVYAEGQPTDTLQGSWALADAEGRIVARDSGRMSLSACDPGAEQVGSFSAAVPPGEYRLDLAVRGRGG